MAFGGWSFVNELNDNIKVFLTKIDNVEAMFRGTAKHKWEGKAKPASLINLPKNFKKFPSLYNVRDGNRENCYYTETKNGECMG